MAQSNLAFADIAVCNEPFAYHDVERRGYVSILTRSPGAQRSQQTTVKLIQLPEALAAVNAANDVWIGQNEFFRPNRRLVSLTRLCACYLDIDTYKMEHLRGLSPASLGMFVQDAVRESGLPAPSLVVYSGQGVQLKWLLERPVPKDALPRWQAVQAELCRRLAHIGADPRALDASRVLRVVGTVNNKTGQAVRILDTLQVIAGGATPLGNGYLGYAFETLATEVLPLGRSELEVLREERAEDIAERAKVRAARKGQLVVLEGGKGRASTGRPLIPSSLAWDRYGDLERLISLRGWKEGVPPGHRDVFVFLAACFLSQAHVAPALFPEVVEFVRAYVPAWRDEEIRSCVCSVMARAEMAMRGQMIEFDGVERDPRYFFRNRTLVDLLEISSTEQAQLKTIIGETESKRRDAQWHRDRRRAAGARSREEVEAEREAKRQEAKQLRAQGLCREKVATLLGVSIRTVDSYVRT